MTTGEWRETVRKWLSDGCLNEMLPEVAALRGVPQTEVYHEEGDAFVHTMLAIAAVDDDDDPRVFLGTLLHDIGKSVKTFFEGGRWRSVGHAEAGAGMGPAIMDRLGLPEMASDVAWLVRHHLFHFSWNPGQEFRPTRNQRRFMEHPLFPLLLDVCLADAAGSLGRSSKGDRIRIIAELFEEEYARKG